MAKKQRIEFVCPECGCRKFTEYGSCDVTESGATGIIITTGGHIELDYDQHGTQLSGAFEILEFQCASCTFRVEDKDGNAIDDYEGLVEWMQKRPKQA